MSTIRSSPAARTSRRARASQCLLEILESRTLLSATALTPAEVRHAYGFDQITGDGQGQTIAIVDVGTTPTLMPDLDVFDSKYSLNGDLSLYSQYGASANFLTVHPMKGNIRADAGWAQETALDVEWAHAIAPGAKILLVQAASPSFTDMLSAVNFARNQPSVSVISMSWGGVEWSSEKNLDNNFTTPNGHKGITFVASSGDVGGITNYPATSPNVLAVGGTTLQTTDGNYAGETVWSDSGGGMSGGETAPTWQTAFNGATMRLSPDVAYDADPNTGFVIYDSFKSPGWMVIGGTSAGAPQWAGLIAIADQLRASNGMGSLDGASQTLPAIYNAPASNFHDITSGSNGQYFASTGYDLSTGRGSPVADQLILTLANTNLAGAGSTPTPPPGKKKNHGHKNRTRRHEAEALAAFDSTRKISAALVQEL